MGFAVKFAKFFTSTRSKMRASQLAGIQDKIDMCSDAKVKAAAEELMSAFRNGGTKRRAQRDALNKAEHLLDSVNVAEGKYSTLYHELMPHRYNPKKQITFSSTRQIAKLDPSAADNPVWDTVSRFGNMKRYISQYSTDSKMSSHLWEQYYLSTLDAETSKFLKQIDSEFGVKIFMDKPVAKSRLQYLYEELSLARKAGGNDVNYFPVVDLTDFDPMIRRLSKGQWGAYGLCSNHKNDIIRKSCFGKRVAVNPNHITDTTFRHEFIGHGQDKEFSSLIQHFSSAKLSKAEIRELQDAGVIDLGWLQYAGSTWKERKAVFAQADASKLSAKTIAKLEKKGWAKWIKNLETVDMEKYVRSTFTDSKSLNTLSEIRATCHGKIPNEISLTILDNPQRLDDIAELMKIKYPNSTEPMFWYAVTDIEQISSARINLIKKFVGLNVNGKNPYLDDVGTMLSHENFTIRQVEKLYSRAEKAAQKGEAIDLRAFYNRFFRFKDYYERQKVAQKALGENVTNVTRKAFP